MLKISTLLCLGLSVAAVPAQAAVYLFTPTSFNQAAQTLEPQVSTTATFPQTSLSITDQAVSLGSFNYHFLAGPPTFSGDVSSLIEFKIGNRADFTNSGPIASRFDVSLNFAADGSITSGSIFYLSDAFEIQFSGTGSAFGGFFSPSDNSQCGFNSSPQYNCQVTGRLAATVPEPTTAALLVAPLLGIVAFRRWAA